MYKKIILLLFLIINLSYNNYSLGKNSYNFGIEPNKALYMIVVKQMQDEESDVYYPLIQICKLDTEKQVQVVQEFKGEYKTNVDMFNRNGIFMIYNTFYNSNDIETSIISTDTPWKRLIYKKSMLEDLYPIKTNSRDSILSINYENRKKTLVNIVDLETATKTSTSINTLRTVYYSNTWLKIEDKQIYYFIGNLKAPVSYISLSPTNVNQIFMVSSNDNYILLRNPVIEKKATEIFFLNRAKQKWDEYTVNGEETNLDILGPYIVCKIGWEKVKYEPTFYSGEWNLINYTSGEKINIKLSLDSKILHATKKYLLVSSDNSLIYVPINNGKVCINDEKVVLEKFNGSIEGVFIGPKTIPNNIN